MVIKSGGTETTQAWVADELCKVGGRKYGLLRTEYIKHHAILSLPLTSINHIYASYKFPHNLTQTILTILNYSH